MFRLRQDQMDLFQATQSERHAHLKALELRRNFPRVFQFYEDHQLLAWVKRQLARAEAAGIDCRRSESTLLNLYALFGEDFERSDERQWAKEVLAKSLDPEHKISLLADRLLP